MVSWVVIGVLYAVVIVAFRLLGGISSAMDAVRHWGSASSGGAGPTASI